MSVTVNVGQTGLFMYSAQNAGSAISWMATLIIGSYSTLLKRAHTKSSSFLLLYSFLLEKHSPILQELNESHSKVTKCSKKKKKDIKLAGQLVRWAIKNNTSITMIHMTLFTMSWFIYTCIHHGVSCSRCVTREVKEMKWDLQSSRRVQGRWHVLHRPGCD